MTKLASLFILLAISSSCIKTADQVQREKRFESMSEQMKDSQGLLTELLNETKSMRSELDKLNGRLEVVEHQQKQLSPDQMNKMSETLNVMKTQEDSQNTQLLQIQNEMKEQRAFIEKVTASLSSVKETHSPKKSSKKKSAKEELSEALTLVKKNKYTDAREDLESLIDHPDLTPGDHNKVLQGLGKVEYFGGNPDKALVYFSKVYTKYPQASIAPSCLLYIGRSLEKLGKKDEAKQAYLKVVEDYPKSKEANEAKKEI